MDAVEELPSVDESSGQHGVVVEVSSSLCRVAVNERVLVCGVRGSLSAEDTGFTNVVAVGDRVIVSEDGADRGVVEAVLPRRSVLARPDVFYNGGRTRDRHLQQVIVANADQLLIVASWRNPTLWPELVDRYLIAAERNNLSPIICVNKIDLAEDIAICRADLRSYLDLGYRVIFTSALAGYGISELRETLRGQTTVLAGMSGVGKSSLLNAIQPGLQIRTKEVSDHSHEGRHATTQVSMKRLDMGGFVVDTPGIREFGLSGLRRGELARFYPEIVSVEWACRFDDCSHIHEPGCAVAAAVKQGRMSEARYHNYTKIYQSLPA
jgi:ribosome biogenesis GTPase